MTHVASESKLRSFVMSSRAVYDGASAAKRPIGTFCEEKGVSTQLQVSLSSRYELSC